MKKSAYLILYVLVLFSCQIENESYLNENETLISNEKKIPIKPIEPIEPIEPIDFCNLSLINVSASQSSPNENPTYIDFNWALNYDSDCSYITNAYFEINDSPYGTGIGYCNHNYVFMTYPIEDLLNTNSITLDINHLTDTPFEVWNPHNPPTYVNLVYGSKCFYWRVVAEEIYCQHDDGFDENDQLCSSFTASDWTHFQFNY